MNSSIHDPMSGWNGDETCDKEFPATVDDNRLNKNAAAVQLIAIINGLWKTISLYPNTKPIDHQEVDAATESATKCVIDNATSKSESVCIQLEISWL